jgi:hypothetical protein
MRALLLFVALGMAAPALAQKLYKHVDENGNVLFSDRPPQAGHKAETLRSPNVAAPEATRQLQYAEYRRLWEEHLERQVQQQRYFAQRRREMEAEREKRAQEADPYSPEQAPSRPRVRRRPADTGPLATRG